MNKSIIIILLSVISFLNIQAQSLSIAGMVFEQNNQALIGANVTVLRAKDSTVVDGTATNAEGKFRIANLKPGKYIVKVSFIGYEEIFVNKELATQNVFVGKLTIKEKTNKIDEVVVKSAQVRVQQKEDTTQLNATAFKTNPDANAEDLVSKMPGITVQDGKVQAHGEDVKKVLVDGKEFFGDDASAVLKNLSSEMVDKIQIFDQKSEQSLVTGFDDGNSYKTMNIVTKTQFKNGLFGKVYGGYGYEDKWKGGLILNYFKDKRRITVLANTNNINEQNFSPEDLVGVMGSGGNNGGPNRGGGGGGGGGNYQGGPQGNNANSFLVNQKSGITTTNSLGLNYSDQWKRLTLTGSYFINYSKNNSVSDLYRQYISTQNEGLIYKENQVNNSKNINHRLNFKFDWKIDSSNSLLFQPRLSIQQNDGSSALQGDNTIYSKPQSTLNNNYSSNLKGINFSAPILLRHLFEKKGRTFSINITPGYNKNSGKSKLQSLTKYFSDTISIDSLNQQAKLDVQGLTVSSNIDYTEPINKNNQLLFSYGANYNKNESNKETFNFSSLDNSYNSYDTSLSNKYNSHYITQSLEARYKYQTMKSNLSLGVAYQYAELKGEQIFPNSYNINKTFNNILPRMEFNYKFSSMKNLRIEYRSSNNAPTVSQLQNVINNTNSLQLSTGNQTLSQDQQNSLSFRLTSANPSKATSLFSVIRATVTQDYIGKNTFIALKDTALTPEITLAKGSQLTKPENMNGYYNIRSFNNYSFPVTFLKSNFSVNLGGQYSKTPSIINTKKNYAYTTNVGLGLSLSSNFSEKIDFTISSNTTYNKIDNTLQTKSNNTYYNQNTKLKAQVMPWKWLVLQTDLSHQYNKGLSKNYNQNYLLWNAAIGYKFLKNRRAEFRLSIYDILKQNLSVTRNTTETYFEDVHNNVLKQYLLLTFTYDIK